MAAPKISVRVYANAQSASSARGIISATSGVEDASARHERKAIMLYTIAVVLVILWLLGLVTSYTMGGFIHVLLVVALIVVLMRLISGRSPL
jgi:high-affinity K+ transport system ATPase subunit B